MELYSSILVVSDGTLKQVQLNFEFRDRSFIHVYENGTHLTEGVDWTWGSNNTILFNKVVPKDTTIIVRRLTDLTAVPHIFGPRSGAYGNSEFTYFTVDDNFKYILEAAQDAIDSYALVGVSAELAQYWAKYSEEQAGIARQAASEANAAATTASQKAAAAATSQAAAKASENAAKLSENAAKASQNAAKTSETNAKTSENAAAASNSSASTHATNARNSATASANSASAAKTSETNAKNSENAARTSQNSATSSANSASTSATQAAGSASAASGSATQAKASENKAKDWATKLGAPVEGSEYSSKHWAQQAAEAVKGDVIYDNTGKSVRFSGKGTAASPLSAVGVTGTGAHTLAAGDDARIVGAMQKAQNLNDLTNKATARSNLGLESAATQKHVVWSENNAPGVGLLMPTGFAGIGTPDHYGIREMDFSLSSFPNGLLGRFEPDSPGSPLPNKWGLTFSQHNGGSVGTGRWVYHHAISTDGNYVIRYRINDSPWRSVTIWTSSSFNPDTKANTNQPVANFSGNFPYNRLSGLPATFPPTIGNTSTTAKAGNWTPDWSEIRNRPAIPPTQQSLELNAVGQYSFAVKRGAPTGIGFTASGADLRRASVGSTSSQSGDKPWALNVDSTSPGELPGTWRNLGALSSNSGGASLWVRIS